MSESIGVAGAAQAHAATHGAEASPGSRTSFWALSLGSIGVVYGDIGTSPPDAVREAVVAASGGGAVTSDAVVGVISLILWSLTIVVTLKVRDRAAACRQQRRGWDARPDGAGAPGQRSLGGDRRRTGHHWCRAIFWRRTNYTRYFGLVGTRRHKGRHAFVRLLRGSRDRHHLVVAVCRPIMGNRPRRRVLRTDHAHMVCRHRGAGGCLHHHRSMDPDRHQSVLRTQVSGQPRCDRVGHARGRVSRRNRGGSSLCRPRSFRPRTDPDRLAGLGVSIAGPELSGAREHCC